MKLAYYSHLLPLLSDDDDRPLAEATVFDCRNLPVEFLDDTGDAVFEEMRELKSKVILPYQNCYFEFSDQCAGLVETLGVSKGELEQDGDHLYVENYVEDNESVGNFIYVHTFADWHRPHWFKPNGYHPESDFWFKRNATHPGQTRGVFPNALKIYAEGEIEFFNIEQFTKSDEEISAWEATYGAVENHEWHDRVKDNLAERMARRILAVLSLLSERLLAAEYRPDPSPQLNKARRKLGRVPVSGAHHVLTINVAAVRRLAKPSNLTHESPALHWRRGHWRVLHRGSEFEDKTWVKRCLVGDPSRGFIHKDYRLIWSPTMIKPDMQ